MYFAASVMYFRQACCAAWNAADVISRPCGSTDTPLAFTVGSGKFVMPRERMQPANLSISGETICCCAAVSCPPSGSRCRHALYADAGASKPALLLASVHRVLSAEASERSLAGQPREEICAMLARAFDLLEPSLGSYGIRAQPGSR